MTPLQSTLASAALTAVLTAAACGGGDASAPPGNASGAAGSLSDGGGAAGDASTGGSGGANQGGAGGSAGSFTSCATEPSPVTGASGKSLVIAMNGDDASGDGSVAKPLRTLKKACALAQPGDAIEVRGGTWNTPGDKCGATGTADHPVHVRPYAGESVILDATGQPLTKSDAVIAIEQASYVVLDGFEIANSSGRGVNCWESVGITLRNLRVHDTAYRALGGGGQDLVIENNEVWNASLSNENDAFGGGGWPAAVSTYARDDGSASRNVVIRNNHIHDVWGECVIALFADGVTIEGNRIHDCYSVSLYVDNSRNVRIERNQIWVTTTKYNKKSNGKPATGITFATESYGSGVPQQRIENLVIANNLITDTGRGIGYWHDEANTAAHNTWQGVSILHNVLRHTQSAALSFDSVVGAPAPSAGVIANNIVWAGDSQPSLELGDPAAWQLISNVWPDGKPAEDTSAGSLSADPGLSSPQSASTPEGFKLLAGSPCAGAGAPAPLVSVDFWCAPRSATAPSMGVHEP
ncbi:MAG: right-handed parallel beta-helix repeat-containing protein [Deltaproteobacteria bacterium]|nr:right-handed parallel beta-helix repeat-containing protein [Deltaproteobacteria bacterium]